LKDKKSRTRKLDEKRGKEKIEEEDSRRVQESTRTEKKGVIEKESTKLATLKKKWN